MLRTRKTKIIFFFLKKKVRLSFIPGNVVVFAIYLLVNLVSVIRFSRLSPLVKFALYLIISLSLNLNISALSRAAELYLVGPRGWLLPLL